MDTEELLNKILNAATAQAIFSKAHFKKEYLHYQKLLHPDVCHLPGATEAALKLNLFRKDMEAGTQIQDDAGTMTQLDDRTLVFKGDTAMLLASMTHYQRLIKLNDPAAGHFKKYLPQSMTLEENALIVTSHERLVPLSQLTLLQEHVTWITSRLFELVSWFYQTGYCHAGINPESVCVVPETHGIVCTSFYHVTPAGSRLNTVSGRYLNWYPDLVFKEKKAIPYIDLSLVQRTALCLLGDASGNGIKLKNTHNEHLIDFLITPHYQPYETFDAYRNLLFSLFGKPKFHKLEI